MRASFDWYETFGNTERPVEPTQVPESEYFTIKNKVATILNEVGTLPCLAPCRPQKMRARPCKLRCLPVLTRRPKTCTQSSSEKGRKKHRGGTLSWASKALARKSETASTRNRRHKFKAPPNSAPTTVRNQHPDTAGFGRVSGDPAGSRRRAGVSIGSIFFFVSLLTSKCPCRLTTHTDFPCKRNVLHPLSGLNMLTVAPCSGVFDSPVFRGVCLPFESHTV